MGLVKFQIWLDGAAFRALKKLAAYEYRELRYEAALLIRESLRNRNLLSEGDSLTDKSSPSDDEISGNKKMVALRRWRVNSIFTI
jgi:hypothetical protein